jgi:hypothetical protein
MGGGKKSSYDDSNKRKSKILGICFSKARRLLVNKIIRKAFEDESGSIWCARCGEEITGNWHIDHLQPWLRDPEPLKKYLDLSNIALSHPECNCLSRSNHRKFTPEEAAKRAAESKRRSNKKRYWSKKAS